jgi:four helix bundle protein
MRKNRSHEDLVAWQKGHQLTLDVFRTVNDVDPVLFEFMKESALRVVSKIAEGISKHDLEERIADLEDANGATARLSTQILLSGQLDYLSKERSEELYANALEVSKIVKGLIRYIRRSSKEANN